MDGLKIWKRVQICFMVWVLSPERMITSAMKKHALLVLALLCTSCEAQEPPVTQEDRPNLLFIITDDQRFDMLGIVNPILETPNIDRLATEGVRFENAFVTTPICAASRASLLTGLVERTHQSTFGTPPLAVQFTDRSYPVLLRENAQVLVDGREKGPGRRELSWRDMSWRAPVALPEWSQVHRERAVLQR